MKTKIRIIASALVLAAAFLMAQQLLMPKYASDTYEGALIREYYGEVKDHDVIFIGDCEVYENISPVTLWEEYGITSYTRGSAQQLIWNSYYLLEETFQYEKPDVVVYNVLAMKYATPQSEEFNRITLDDMRLSLPKLKAVAVSREEGEGWLSYLFPILRYHDRWDELTADDFKYFFSKPDISVNGFMIRSDILPDQGYDISLPLADYRFSDNCYKYLDMMTALCKKNGVGLVLMKAPLTYPWWYEEWDAQMVDYAKENDLMYVNFLDLREALGLDMTRDTFNGGLNLNVYGAEKMAKYFGKVLQEEYGLPDRRNEPETAARWNAKSALYHGVKAKQLEEIEELGEIRTYLMSGS